MLIGNLLSKFSIPNRRRIQRATLGCFGLIFLSLFWKWIPLNDTLEQFSLDYRYSHFNRETHASDQVLLIDIDESSMKLLGPHFGRWPWSRKVYKQLIEFLAQGDPAGIYFDLLFTEASSSDDGDQQVADASVQAGMVSHAMLVSSQSSVELGSSIKQGEINSKQSLLNDKQRGSEFVPLPQGIGGKFGVHWTRGLPPSGRQEFYRDFNLPAETILAKIPHLHVVTSEKDSDGLYRRAPMFFHYDQAWFPSLALKAVSARMKNPKYSFLENSSTQLAVQIDDDLNSHLSIPLDQKLMLPLHFYRSDRDIEIVPIAAAFSSATKLQSGEVSDLSQLQLNPLTLKNKIVIIGASAAGLYDLKATPVSSSYPGSLLHATAISNILTQDFLSPISANLQALLNVFTIFLTYASVFFIGSIIIKVLLPLFWMTGYVAFAFYLFQKQNVALEVAKPLLLGALATFDGLAYLVFVEAKDIRKLKEALSKYLSPSVSEQIIASGQDPRAEVGQYRELSVLFSDIRGFTSLSEKLNPQDLVSLLNEYLGCMTDVIFGEMGTLDKFIGDAIMAFWGAPIASADHAVRSLRCAIKMKAALGQLNLKWSSQGIHNLNIGIGINTGDVIVGNIGSEKRLDYTVIGDNVNLASRLESITKQYGLMIIVGERTEELVRGSYICRPIDFVAVKGKEHCVKIYEPLGEVSGPNASIHWELVGRFSDALGDY
ncbi:MAG: adenylate/guanylate cyclase domain-containing protein, partial [Bdellovibrionia bacterium]